MKSEPKLVNSGNIKINDVKSVPLSVALLISLSLFGLAVFRALVSYWPAWNDSEGYYTHWPLVLPVVLYLVWRNRFRLQNLPFVGYWGGVILTFAGVICFLAAASMQIDSFYGPGITLILLGIAGFMLGSQALRYLAFPIVFLGSAWPIGKSMLDTVTAGFQMFSTTMAAAILSITGVPIVREGNIIQSYNLPQSLYVASPCSGLKLLISMIMFGMFFAYMTKSPLWKKAFLVALCFPLSIFMNSLRIAAIGWAGVLTYSGNTMNKVHDGSAVPTLILAFLILLGISKLIGARQYHDFDSQLPNTENKFVYRRIPLGLPYIFGTLLLTVCVVYGFLISDLNDMPKGKLIRSAVSRSFGNWTATDQDIESSTAKILDKADLMSRVYVNVTSTKPPILLFNSSSLDPTSLHDPRICLPGGGSRIINDEEITIDLRNVRIPSVKASLLRIVDGLGTKAFVLNWYMIGDKSYARTYPDMNNAYMLSRLGDFGTLLVNPFAAKTLKTQIYSRQIIWYRFSMDGSTPADLEYLNNFVREFVSNVKNFGEFVPVESL